MSAKAQPNDIEFNRSFEGEAGELVELSPLVRRMTVGNPGPMTFTGTCTYIVGREQVMVIDPGPVDEMHCAALLKALGSEKISHILVTHTHRDHSPGATALSAATGAKIIGCAPYAAREGSKTGETSPFDLANDLDYRPDWVMLEGDRIEGQGFDLIAVATPGHTMNHLAYALPQEHALFSGDHVMAWSTSVVAPPDGNMRHYMSSLEKLRQREDAILWPGHGGPVTTPQRYLRALTQHRRAREQAILARVRAGDRTIAQMAAHIYQGLDARLFGAASFSILAHLEALVERGLIGADPAVSLTANYHSN
jgi:glyoxylase-like metal-dependent hydrolase (beta-lactamase superfamily II)